MFTGYGFILVFFFFFFKDPRFWHFQLPQDLLTLKPDPGVHSTFRRTAEVVVKMIHTVAISFSETLEHIGSPCAYINRYITISVLGYDFIIRFIVMQTCIQLNATVPSSNFSLSYFKINMCISLFTLVTIIKSLLCLSVLFCVCFLPVDCMVWKIYNIYFNWMQYLSFLP